MFYYNILRLQLKIHFIYAIPFIFRFLVLIVTSSHPAMVSLFFFQHNDVFSLSTLLIVIFGFFGFLIAHECDHSFWSLLTSELLCWEIILLPYTPLGSLILDLSYAVVTTPSMATDLVATTDLYPLSLPLAAHPSKKIQYHYTTALRW